MNDILNKTSTFVTDLFEKKLPGTSVYHNLNHTKEVVETVKEIGENSDLNQEDLYLAQIAAWLHDTGFIDDYHNHEEKSIDIAKKFLTENNFSSEKIEIISGMINATKMKQSPKNIIEEVLCDADLSHIGKKGFISKSRMLRTEWELTSGTRITKVEWLKNTIDFVSENTFFTEYAKKTFGKRRLKNLEKLQLKLKEVSSDDSGKINSNKKTKKSANRGIETMFRNVIRTHVEFSGMADSKANIMISVNTLLLTAVVAFLAKSLDTNPNLIIPTAIITIVSLTSLIMAITVTRPKITSGTFTGEDVKNKKANLLFFGNFYNMDLKNFEWGMMEMIHDSDYLYGSMIKDFYFLGQVLGQKYKKLRVCYNFFMYGLIISIIAFAIAVIFYPNSAGFGPLIE